MIPQQMKRLCACTILFRLHLFHLFGIEPGSQAGQAKELQSQVEHLRLENTVIRNEVNAFRFPSFRVLKLYALETESFA